MFLCVVDLGYSPWLPQLWLFPMLYGPGLALVGYFSCLVLSYLTLSCLVHLFGEVSPLSLPFPDQEKMPL